MRFVALDVETANPRYHSICQIGVVLFEDGREVDSDVVYVDPREEFGEWQIRVHGIQPHQVLGSPCFAEHHEWLARWTAGQTVVSHSGFDRSAIGLACSRFDLPHLDCGWIDSMELAMQAWPGLKSYALREVAGMAGITYRAHDALEDARACGLLALHALSGGTLGKAPNVIKGGGRWPTSVRRAGDGDGGLLGETIVFTGELSVARELAADMAAEAGGNVIPGVTKKTTMLVVGDRDLQPGWPDKSGKHRRAEELIEQGVPIRIVSEADFLAFSAIKD